ncbi:DUF7619 domain-containing protein [Pedobacter sp. SL55]|uniref:DUF7849 domain-containing protein n=1 Tax=Pedobacter sp. SL55 TaxID=2995161 RepID=UPI00226EC2A1|nr:hypothetical protein [Pedobacter sp. SL55]WAC40827.1 hypothetical protein OVA16_00115 [Pedobacter sp. SL55]
MTKLLTSILCCFCLTAALKAQVLPSDTVPAIIRYETANGVTKFTSELRPLRAIAGAPAPFYTYFWEFGDGGFSFEENPSHIYTRYDSIMVRLFATNNYDDGKRPPTRPKPIVRPLGPKPAVAKPMLAANGSSNLFKMGGNIEMKTNCMPKPGDDMMLVFGYRNKVENGQQNLNGTIAILYNDVEFSNNNFELAAARTYHHEKKSDLKPLLNTAYLSRQQKPIYYASLGGGLSLSSAEKILLKDQAKAFKNQQSWKFENLKQNEERFVFMHFKTTPEMLKDTNAVVRISGAFIPDNPLVETEFFNLELQIVASHDPNKMVLRKSRMNYRLTGKNRELTYKVRFQNTGKGPAKKIDVGVNIAEVFDPTMLKVTKTKPEVITCDSAYANQSCLKTFFRADSVHFVFSNIYLPGMQQKGVNDADSTQGFVEYKIRFKEKPPKLPIKSGAAIVFDKNEPIYTNRAAGRFKMGLSPGVIVGYGFPFETNNNNYLNHKNVALGATLSPYASHRYYWQVELYFNSFNETTYRVPIATEVRKDTVINNVAYQIMDKQLFKTTKVATINAVPLQMRYNINKYVGVGAGALVALDMYNRTSSELRYKLRTQNASGTVTDVDLNRAMEDLKDSFSEVRVSFFADVQLGLVRVGPALGFRYIYDPKTNNNRMTTYVSWKF